MMKVMVTGGMGFIGSHLVKKLLEEYNCQVVIVDSFTYAAREKLYSKKDAKRLKIVKADIRDQLTVSRFMREEAPEFVFHLAAESHVCRSISGPKAFMETNVMGTWNMIEEFRGLWQHSPNGKRFIHVSTDEVFGQLKLKERKFNEQSPIAPRSPYSSSKAASDNIVSSYFHTYGVETITVNCSNNYGPNQHGEKLLPKTICRILQGKPVDIYQQGTQVRDWLWVEDCCDAIVKCFEKGIAGERYCIGGDSELTNLQLVRKTFAVIQDLLPSKSRQLQLNFVNARPTDDFRYAIDASKIKRLGWKPKPEQLEKNIRSTVLWYYGKLMSGGGHLKDEGAE